MAQKNCQCGNEVVHEVRQALQDQSEHEHQHLAAIANALRVLTGITERLLMKFEEAYGTPRGTPYVLSQPSPGQNTVYTGKPLAYDGVIRSLVLSGPGNVTLTLNDKLSIGGSTVLAIVSCNGNAVPVDLHLKIQLNSTLSISTDSNAGTGLVALTAWIEPIKESNPEYFQMRR